MPADAKEMLDLAARLAYRGFGYVEPNPLVGCVICKPSPGPARDRIIGMGHHRRFGDIHAEVDALNNCRERGHDPAGATVYVTLEPCNAAGKQPPCVDALLKAKVARVIIARRDPNPAKGGGAARLQAGGVAVEFTTASDKAVRISDPFVKRVTTGLPWIIAKWAQSIDGRIATSTGESKWISGELSRRRVHQLRARVDAIWTGAGTVLADNPTLTARGVPVRRIAKRVVDANQRALASLTEPLNILHDTGRSPTVFVLMPGAMDVLDTSSRGRIEQTGATLMSHGSGPLPREMYAATFRRLNEEHGVATLLIEAGRGIGNLIQWGLVDELQVYVAPILIGEGLGVGDALMHRALNAVPRFELISHRRVGDDVRLVYRRPVAEGVSQN
jgi:diaminohydroxyphosphoribosylaminopyrimidine deaminase/5-amino-6-(5-phosphoribosylamino)uracil reductase